MNLLQLQKYNRKEKVMHHLSICKPVAAFFLLIFVCSRLLAVTGIPTVAVISIPESPGNMQVVTITATGAVGAITYSLSGGADISSFRIDPVTGILSFKFFPDYEQPRGRNITPTSASAANVYRVTVRADDAGNSTNVTKSFTITVTNVPENPDPPRDLFVVSGDQSNILNWTASVDLAGITEYRIYRSEDSITWSYRDAVPVGTNTYTDINLLNGKFYFYSVRAWNGISESVNSNIDASTPYEQEISRYMHFDGNNDYLVASDSSKLMGAQWQRGTTMECWVRFNTLPLSKVYILSRDYNMPNVDLPSNGSTILRWYSIYYDPNAGGPGIGKIVFEYNVRGSSTYQKIVNSITVPVANKWYHIAGTFKFIDLFTTDSIRLYINSNFEKSSNTTNGNVFENYMSGIVNLYPAESRFVIGGTTTGLSPFTYGNFLNGDIAEVRYWTTDLDQSTIQANMYKRLRGDETNLIGLWHLDTLFNNSVYDYDNLNFNAIRRGDVFTATPQTEAMDDAGSVLASIVTNINVKENDTYTSPGKTVLTKIISGPSHGSASVINRDSIAYNPSCFIGTDTIKYLICDTTFFNNPYKYSDTAIAVITVNDNPPVITSNGGTDNASISINENIAAVTTVTATDIDICHLRTYSLSGGADQALFIINGTSGVLSFASAPDFETPTDAGANNVYEVTVTVSDGTLSDAQDISVTVMNVNEAPVITSDGGGATATVNANENNTAATTVVATDADASTTLIYSITGGADQAKFSIIGSTGVLTFVTAPDLEIPTDVGGNNIYDVQVTASDGSLTDAQNIAVTIINVNEAPVITSGSAVNISENSNSVMTVTATDPDVSTTLNYIIVSAFDGAKFSINSSTGELSFIGAPDYENPSDIYSGSNNNSYGVIVRVSDGTLFSVAVLVTVTVLNVNEAPEITSDGGGVTATVNANENNTAATIVVATDADASTTLTYSISGGADQTLFAINGTTGVIAFATAPNYETPTDAGGNNIYDVQVTVSDGLLTDVQDIAVNVLNVNEAPTDIAITANAVDENQASGTAVGDFSSIDPDPANTHTYTLVAGVGSTDNASFQLVGNQLRTNAIFNYETKNSYTIRVRTTDNGTGSLYYEEAFTITVNDLNEAPTDIAITANAVDENQASGTAVGNFSSTDPDPANTHTYTLVAGVGSTDNGSFQLVGNQLRTNAIFNYETKNSYTIRVRTTDNGTGSLYYEEVFTITVNDLNDTPTDISITSNTVNENQPIGTLVGTLSATDDDTGDTHTYTLVGGTGDTDNGSFQIVGSQLQTNAIFDYDIKSTFTVRIRTTDNGTGNLIFEKSFTINLLDENFAPIDIILSKNIVSENQPAGSAVGNLFTTDPDAGNTFIYTLETGTGDTDNGNFQLDGNQLQTNSIFNYGTKNSYSIRVRTTDQDGLYFEKTFNIYVGCNNRSNFDWNLIPNGNNPDMNTYIEDGLSIHFRMNDPDNIVNVFNTNNRFQNTQSVVWEQSPGTTSETSVVTIGFKTPVNQFCFKLLNIDYSGNNKDSIQIDPYFNGSKKILDAGEYTLSSAVTFKGNNTFVGNTSVTNPATLGNAEVCILSATDSILINYGNSSSLVGNNQSIGIGNFSWCELPNHAPQFTNSSGVDITFARDTCYEDITDTVYLKFMDEDLDSVTISTVIPKHGIIPEISMSDSTFKYIALSNYFGYDTIQVIIKDNRTLQLSDTLLVYMYINPVNDPPTFTVGNNQSVAEDSPAQTVNGWATAVDKGNIYESLQTLSFTLTNENNSLFSSQPTIDANGNLTFTPAPDATGSATVDVVLKDNGGLVYGGVDSTGHFTFTITVNAVNDVPSDITLTNNNVDENQLSGTLVGTLGTMDTDVGDTHTYSILAGTDGAMFAIDVNNLNTSAIFNFEVKNSYTITIRTTDSQGAYFDEDFTILVNDLNDVPTDIVLSRSDVDELKPVGTGVGKLSAIDEDSGDIHTYSITGTDAASFTIDGDSLRTNEVFNFMIKSSYTITVTTNDGNATFNKTFVITINKVNSLPTDITLTNSSIDENQLAVTVIGTLSTSDADLSNTHIYSISGTDASLFVIDGDQLKSLVSFNYEVKLNYSLTITTTDNNNGSYSEDFIITINDINDAPTDINLSNASVDEYLPSGTLVGMLSSIDEDAGDSHSYTITGSDAAFFAISGNSLVTVGTFNYINKSVYNIIIRTTDSNGAFYDKPFVINVNNINEAPMVLNTNNNPADTLSFDTYENETLTVCLNISDPDNDVISISGLYSITGSGNLSITENTTCFDYRPADGFIGIETLLSIVCDNGSPSLCDSVMIIMNVRPQFIFSQVISPNNDSYNDVWIIGGLERYPANEVKVFSRWGDLIYQISGYNNTTTVWDGEINTKGNFSQKQAPEGTYFYIIELGNGSKLTGFIVLKR